MPFSSTAADMALVRNPATGKFDFAWDATNNPVHDDTQTHRCLSLLIEHRGEWTMDRAGDRGSTWHKIKNDTRATKSTIENTGQAALAKAVRGGFISDPIVVAQRTKAGRYDVAVRYTATRPRTTTTTLVSL